VLDMLTYFTLGWLHFAFCLVPFIPSAKAYSLPQYRGQFIWRLRCCSFAYFELLLSIKVYTNVLLINPIQLHQKWTSILCPTCKLKVIPSVSISENPWTKKNSSTKIFPTSKWQGSTGSGKVLKGLNLNNRRIR
jgi:hypothetical protein